jgi:hypothetical protein
MKLTKQRATAVRKVITEHRLIQDRVRVLYKRGYDLKLSSLVCKWGCIVGKVHKYSHTSRLQIGTPYGYYKYAWMVIFDPSTEEEISKINKDLFGGLVK